MPDYKAPVADMLATLRVLAPLSALGRDDLDEATQEAVLYEAAKLAEGVLAPINATGDKEGARWHEGGVVKTASGFKEAYQQYCSGGWNAVPFDVDFGGQGLPWALSFPVQEMWQAANMSFGLCPLLNQGAVDAILHHGSKALQDEFLPRLISGEWTGTMNLTEPQAGSDLALLKSKAERAADGSYKITGQKIFITYGEHDFTSNIIHLVLARLPDAPEGTKGISLFIVPKFLKDDSGHYTLRNDLTCVSLEHKLGIHASPTCTMAFGDKGGATGYLVGAENEGLKAMFTMMNNARLSVGLQGVAIADRAWQWARQYAAERKQGKAISGGSETVTIDQHEDVKRMLQSSAALVAAGRGMAYHAAWQLDKARTGDAGAQAMVDFMTPVVKAWCTDMSVEVASTSLQVFGGMGFIEETGAAQFYRDARILPIYEGTNGIQSLDLMFRKILRDNGATLKIFAAEAAALLTDDMGVKAVAAFTAANTWLLQNAKDMTALAGACVPYLQLTGTIMGAVVLKKLAAQNEAYAELYAVYAKHILPRAVAYSLSVTG